MEEEDGEDKGDENKGNYLGNIQDWRGLFNSEKSIGSL